MTATHTLPPDLQSFVETLEARYQGAMTIALAELAALMRPARPVRVVGADRWAGDYLASCPTTAFQLVGKQLDRRAVTITNLSLTLGTSGLVMLAPSIDALSGTPGSGMLVVPPGVSLEVLTTAPVYACASTAGVPITWSTEEYDPAQVA